MDVRAAVRDRLGPYRIAKAKRFVAILFRRDLTRLGRLYGTNKASPKQRYTPLYERHLWKRRREPLCVLEIGVGGYQAGTGGSSLRMWRTYFPKARVYGIDIEPRDLREPRVKTFCGSQSDANFLRSIIDEIGAPDLVVDDGSHHSKDVMASFEVLFPLLARRGLYVIEDAHRSYMPDYGGGPPGTSGTSIEFVKLLVDDLVRRLPTAAESEPVPNAIHIYPRIVFIEKS